MREKKKDMEDHVASQKLGQEGPQGEKQLAGGSSSVIALASVLGKECYGVALCYFRTCLYTALHSPFKCRCLRVCRLSWVSCEKGNVSAA